jgi:predicted lipoprotein with Yx(FWY)xxD motif
MNGSGQRRTPRLLAALAGLGVAGAALTACGGGPGGGDGSGESVAPPAIATSSVSGLGTVLVDSSGKTLYFNDEDSGNTLRCTGPCLQFWLPATTTDTAVPPGSVTGLSVVKRSDDGKDQFMYQGRPLYEFTLDAMAGQVNGQDAHDEFEGMSFAWHAAVVTGTAVTASGDAGGIAGY